MNVNEQHTGLKKYYHALMLTGGLVVVALLLIPYASNGFWFDDALNSQVYFMLQRLHGGLSDFSYHAVCIKDWLILHAEGKAPQSDNMSLLTWKESAEQLKNQLPLNEIQ